MGCDIHVHSEIKLNGIWHHYDLVRIERDYELFAYLAGVRGSGQAFPLRGIPKDSSAVTQLGWDWEGIDLHCRSWISSSEIAQVVEHFPATGSFSTGSFLFGNSYEDFLKCKSDYPPSVEDIRWVFWFKG